MKLKNGILSLGIFGLLVLGQKAQAVIFPDENPTSLNASEDENQDAVSSFGSDTARKTKKQKVFQALDPISEASFDHDSSRAPASVVEGSRGPATVKVKASDRTRPKKVIISEAKRARSFQEIAVIANDTGFYPSTVFLTQGVPVRIFITGASAKSQCFMLDQFGVRRQIRSQKIEEITFVPDQVGTFTFNCPMNGAKGNVIVKELELGAVNERVPASVSANERQDETGPAIHEEAKKSEISEDDFAPEFRNK